MRVYKVLVMGVSMKFYTIKLPKILGGIVRAMLNTFKKK
jgi:stage V sporulation protein M